MSFNVKAVLGTGTATATTAACLAACLATAGCGSSDPLSGMTAKQVATKAVNDLKTAPAFTFAGTMPNNGQEMTINLGFKGGKDCAGTMSMGSQGSVALVVIGGTAWLKADDAFWKSQGGSEGSQLGQMLGGKYLKAAATGAMSQLADVCNVNSMISQESLPTDVAKGPITTIGGQKALTLTDKAKQSTMYVTDTATPRIIKIVSKKPGDSGQITVTYGVPKAVTPPPASQTVDGSKFGL